MTRYSFNFWCDQFQLAQMMITIDAGDTTTSSEAMETVEKRLAEMSHNFATKYGIKMELCQA